MLDPSAKRLYQSAEEAVTLINDANRLGKSLELTKEGDIAIRRTPTNAFVLWIRETFGSGTPRHADKEETLKAILATKMKIDLASATAHAGQQLRTFFDDIEQVSKQGSLRDLCTEWVRIKNRIQLNDLHMADKLLFIKAQQEHARAADQAAAVTQVNPPTPAPAPAATSADTFQRRMDEVNQALPSAMVFSGDPNEILTATFALPDPEHRALYASLENAHLDEKSRLASQTWKDCGRADFHLTEVDGFSSIFELGADASEVAAGIISFGRDSRGLSLETGSRLINQQALGTLYTPSMMRVQTRGGAMFLFNKSTEAEPLIRTGTDGNRRPALVHTVFKWTKLADGGAEFEMVQREKIHYLLLDDKMIPVNRGPHWQGDINESNLGYELRTRIRIAADDMRKGSLKNVTIVEPLTITFRIAPGAMADATEET